MYRASQTIFGPIWRYFAAVMTTILPSAFNPFKDYTYKGQNADIFTRFSHGGQQMQYMFKKHIYTSKPELVRKSWQEQLEADPNYYDPYYAMDPNGDLDTMSAEYEAEQAADRAIRIHFAEHDIAFHAGIPENKDEQYRQAVGAKTRTGWWLGKIFFWWTDLLMIGEWLLDFPVHFIIQWLSPRMGISRELLKVEKAMAKLTRRKLAAAQVEPEQIPTRTASEKLKFTNKLIKHILSIENQNRGGDIGRTGFNTRGGYDDYDDDDDDDDDNDDDNDDNNDNDENKNEGGKPALVDMDLFKLKLREVLDRTNIHSSQYPRIFIAMYMDELSKAKQWRALTQGRELGFDRDEFEAALKIESAKPEYSDIPQEQLAGYLFQQMANLDITYQMSLEKEQRTRDQARQRKKTRKSERFTRREMEKWVDAQITERRYGEAEEKKLLWAYFLDLLKWIKEAPQNAARSLDVLAVIVLRPLTTVFAFLDVLIGDPIRWLSYHLSGLFYSHIYFPIIIDNIFDPIYTKLWLPVFSTPYYDLIDPFLGHWFSFAIELFFYFLSEIREDPLFALFQLLHRISLLPGDLLYLVYLFFLQLESTLYFYFLYPLTHQAIQNHSVGRGIMGRLYNIWRSFIYIVGYTKPTAVLGMSMVFTTLLVFFINLIPL
jgi:hypothetical protein